MGNVMRVFLRDMKRIAKNPATWAVILFLSVLPSLYTWFNVAGFWNPYENTGNLRICVVNEDEGVTDKTLGRLDLGTQIEEALKENDQLGWAFVDGDEALFEVESGEAYAAIVIPATFSADLATITSGDFRQPTLEYYVNEKKGPVSPKITDAGASALDVTINETFVSTASATVAESINEKLGESKVKVDQAKTSASDIASEAKQGLDDARTALMNVKDAADEAIAKADSAKQSLSDARGQVETASSGIAESASLVADANTGIGAFSTSINGVLDGGSALASRTTAKADQTIGRLSSSIVTASNAADTAAKRARSVVEDGRHVQKVLENLRDDLPEDVDTSALDDIIDALDDGNGEAESLLSDLETLSSDIADAATASAESADHLDDAIQGTLSNADDYRTTLNESVLPVVSENLAGISTTANELGTSTSNLVLLIDETSSMLDQLKSTLSVTSDAVARTESGLGTLEEDLATIETDLQALQASSELDRLFGKGGINPDRIADFMSSPTQVKTEQLYELNAYGSAMAPLFINLTLWIGVFMLMVIIRIEVDDEGIEKLTITQRFFGRWLLLVILAAIQAIVCVTGCLAMGVQTVNAPAFYATAIVASLAYLSIQYTLSSTLQHVGKAFCIILVFVQIPGATGLYPIEMTPSFFQIIYPMFPFTYGISAIREAICGFYDGTLMNCLGALVGFMIAFLLIGALVRPHMANLNRMFARQIEESDLISGEAVHLPARRYRLSQVIQTLSDREEYREAINKRVASFIGLYPTLQKLSIAVGVPAVIVLTVVFSLLGFEKVIILTTWLVCFAAIVAYLIVLDYIQDYFSHQLSLNSMSDEEVRALYRERNSFTIVRPLARRLGQRTRDDDGGPAAGVDRDADGDGDPAAGVGRDADTAKDGEPGEGGDA